MTSNIPIEGDWETRRAAYPEPHWGRSTPKKSNIKDEKNYEEKNKEEKP